MLSNLFNYVTGALSIISFVITVTPFFPAYKPAVRFATVFFIGTLVGSLFASAQSQPIIFQFEGSLVQALLLGAAVVCAVIVIVLVLAMAMGEKVKENHASAAGSAFGLFVVFISMYAIANYNSHPTSTSKEIRYTARDADEFLSLARYYKGQSNTNLALEYYAKALEATYRDEPKANIRREMDSLFEDKKK